MFRGLGLAHFSRFAVGFDARSIGLGFELGPGLGFGLGELGFRIFVRSWDCLKLSYGGGLVLALNLVRARVAISGTEMG